MPSSVTAIIPCYNAHHYIADAIESVLRQTRRVDEVIVVDDCSTDCSVEIARSYPVAVLSTERNSGHAAARNIGIRAAKGELIAWLDADDYWEPNHCEVVCGLLDEFQDADVAYSRVRFTGARQGVRPPDDFVEPSDAFEACFKRTIVPAMSAVTRRSAILDAGGFRERFRVAPDFDLWLRLSLRCRFVSSCEVTSNYRWHDGQISCNPFNQMRTVFQSRWDMYCQLQATSIDIETLGRLSAIMLADWDERLEEYYYARDWNRFREVLSLRQYLPEQETALSSRLELRAKIPARLLTLYDRVRSVVT